MFRALVQKEVLANLYNQRYVMTLLLLITLVGLSVWSMERMQRIRLENHAEALVGYEDAARSTELAWQFMASGLTREKAPATLGLLDGGLDTEMARALTFAGWKPIEVGPRQVLNPLFQLFRPPDYVYIINVIGSLLALLFVYDAICGEKEQGTLRLMLTGPVPRDYVLLAKWLGGLVSLCVPLALVSLASALYLTQVASFTLSLEQAVRLALVFGVSLLYLSTFFTLGLLVSTLTRRSSTALMFSLFLWIILVLVLPNLTPMVARTLVPVPAEGKMAIERSHREKEVRDAAELTLRPKMPDSEEYEDEVDRLVARELEGLDRFRMNRIQAQVRLARACARLSPSSCYLFASSDLAKTGLGSFRRYQRYVYQYREAFNQAKRKMVQAYRVRARGSGGWWGRMPFDAADIQLYPRFRPLTLSLGQGLRDVLTDVGLLLTFNVAFFLAAYAAFLRYDVR